MTALHSLSAAQAAQWRPGLGQPALHAEVFAPAGDGAGAALALAFAQDHLRDALRDPAADTPDERSWLWVQDKAAIRLSGRPYRPGLPRELRHRLVHVSAASPEDALFAIEEGLRCRDLAFVIGEIAGNPRSLDFTASRRLSLAVERHGVPLWLIRTQAGRDLGSARMRWQAKSARSSLPQRNPRAPGEPAWHAELFRARNHPPGEWILRHEGGALKACPPHPVDLVHQPGDRSLATG
ncbi:hypothetical protein [Novosphingobium sp. TH158]|uniref:hypothetical protein n=1 Tax=Novosphingobium sp. TH158 TaxID=2067455 RepID=UPI001C1FACEB|nr:hypothetical protein [Novosphingobium sp. TH158]